MAEDPSLEAWREDPRLPEVASILAAWRGVAGGDDA
jgi:hypothetical protein